MRLYAENGKQMHLVVVGVLVLTAPVWGPLMLLGWAATTLYDDVATIVDWFKTRRT